MEYLFHERTAYCRFRKYLLIMRLTAALLLICFLHAGATGFSQTVTLSVSNMPLDKVCKEIERQTAYYFVYAKDLKDKERLISVEVKNATVEETLHKVFEGLPFSWQVIEKVVVVNTINQKYNGIDIPVNAETIEIKGRVTNVQGEPLASASVVSKTTKKATSTDTKGEFKLKGLPANDEIIVSYIGYKDRTIKLANQSGLNFILILETTDNELDKTVVQAYGKTSQRLTTSNIGVVSAEEIERQPVMNPLLALQGKVAGLDVIQTNGYASAPVKVEIRGRSGISGNFPSDPLYIIDGVPLTIIDLSNNSSYQNGSTGFDQIGLSPAGGQSPLFSMNSGDIESIEVLKDADATAIYGSRGANGVIIINTKKGRPGKTKFDLNVREGITRVTRYWKLLNTQQYLAIRREAFKNDGLTPDPVADYDVNGTWDTTSYTDWQRTLLSGMGREFNGQASLSGGDVRTSFRISAAYARTTQITTVSGADQRASFSLNFSHRSSDQHFSISSNTSYSYTLSNMVYLPDAFSIAPNAPAIFDSAGNLNFSGWAGNMNNTEASGAYPFYGLRQTYTAKTNFLNTGLNLSYELARGLLINANIGYSNNRGNQQRLMPFSSLNPLSNDVGGSNTRGQNDGNNWIIEPQLNYNAFINKGKLTVLLGGSCSRAAYESLFSIGSGYTDDVLLRSMANAPTINSYDNFGEYHYAAIFGRITYDYKNKYIINLNARRDGSSRFGPGKQYGNFGSVGLAWIVSDEEWVKNILPSCVSFIKLRGSYGSSGSDAVGDYAYLSRYGSIGVRAYGGIIGLRPTQAPDPYFQWQVNKKLEAAINIGLLKDYLNIQVAYYRDRCGNQLVSIPLPAFTGFASVTANSPALVQNSGWELNADLRLIETKRLRLGLNFNVAINRNILLAYPNFSQSPYKNQLIIGKPLNIARVFHYIGVDPQTGNYTFYDKTHDGSINYSPGQITDDTYPVDLSPKFFGGAGINVNYGPLQVNLFFNIMNQIGRNALVGNLPGLLNTNQSVTILGREWQKPGDIKELGRFSTQQNLNSAGNYYNTSDGIYTNASFVRLSNLSITYTLSKQYIKKIGIAGCAIFLQTNNLFVITRYKGADPETQSFGGMPPNKKIVGGINFNL